MNTYQRSFVDELPALIVAAHAQMHPRADTEGAPAISKKLDIAAKVWVCLCAYSYRVRRDVVCRDACATSAVLSIPAVG